MQNQTAALESPAARSVHDVVCEQSCCRDFRGYKLASAFQPIFSLAHRQPVGYEALLRGWKGNDVDVAPMDIFSDVTMGAEYAALEKLAHEMHLGNFVAQRPQNSWLFLNISPAAFVTAPHGPDVLSRVSSLTGLVPYRIVVEVVESAIGDEQALVAAVEYYRRQGCLVALDDFGTGHSNLSRVWSLEPDIVKLDRHLTRQAAKTAKMRRMLSNLVTMLHESGSLVVLEGVETEDDAMLAIDVDVDMMQGYFFASPANLIAKPDSYPVVPSDLSRKFRDVARRGAPGQRRRQLTTPLYVFRNAARALESNDALEAACFHLLRQEGIECSYLLTGDGVQIGKTLLATGGSKVCDPRFAPLFEIAGANWFRRPFFQSAIGSPGQAQISAPYLSLTGAYLCVTLSIAIRIAGVPHVFCCDINWDRVTQDER